LILALAPDARAQSGRRKQQPPAKTPTERPRRTTDAPKPQEKSPQQTSAQKPRTQGSGSPLPDEPPPWPVKPKIVVTSVPASSSGEEVDPDEVVRIHSNLVTVPASVVDSTGKVIAGLKLEDFELKVDGQLKQISDISFSEMPVRMAVLFDNSSSLATAREFEKQAAIKFFRSVMRPEDQAAIYSVSTVPTLEHPLTNNIQALVRTVENFGKPEGATALFDAIVHAASYLKPYQGRKVIIIVSDGEDTISDTTFDDALRLAQAADCQIYAVQTKQIDYIAQTGRVGGSANLRSLAAERRMQELAAQTGGAVYSPLVVKDLDTSFAQIAADLAQQYILSYYPSEERRDGRFRLINLRVITHPSARVRARKGYYAPKS
jgi:Ca-activated chloride channel family protein